LASSLFWVKQLKCNAGTREPSKRQPRRIERC